MSEKRRPKNIPKFLHLAETHGLAPTDVYIGVFNKNLSKISQWDPVEKSGNGEFLHGAIFNMEFSPHGNILVCACENRSVLLFDPYSHQKIGEIQSAHTDCVNCVRFIDPRTFATCSDDKTISIWDIRKLKGNLITLRGHSSWVKSIEFNKSSGQLLSSAFDDTVRLWDINDFSGDEITSGNIALTLPSLVRTKLSPDCSKLFLTTASGLGIIAIHSFDINRIREDCISLDSLIKLDAKEITKRPVNTIERIKKFPGKRNPGCISSIDVHPYGWCILSRYADIYGRSEWTAVHDVQDSHLGGCNMECSHVSSLTHFIDEANVGKGFIKELCFSADGRLICSPFGNGVRILAFDENCNELSNCIPDDFKKLIEIKMLISHKKTVLTSKFSPCLPLLATGCLDGVVSFHHPKL